MKFEVTRSSNCPEPYEAPCEGAVLETVGDGWPRWYIELHTLEELVAFKDLVGTELIIKDAAYHSGEMPCIEIYDDYRE